MNLPSIQLPLASVEFDGLFDFDFLAEIPRERMIETERMTIGSDAIGLSLKLDK